MKIQYQKPKFRIPNPRNRVEKIIKKGIDFLLPEMYMWILLWIGCVYMLWVRECQGGFLLLCRGFSG